MGDFLPTIRRNISDRKWLFRHEAKVRETIRDALKPHRIHGITSILPPLLEVYLRHPSHYHWQELLGILTEQIFVGNVEDQFGPAHLMLGKAHLTTRTTEAKQALHHLITAGQISRNDEDRIKAYTELLRATINLLPPSYPFEPDSLCQDLLDFAKTEADDYTQILIYYAVGVHYFRKLQAGKTLQYMQVTIELASTLLERRRELEQPTLDIKTHLIEALIVQGTIHRLMKKFHVAYDRFEEARFLLDPEVHTYQEILIAHEIAHIAKARGQIELAVTDMRFALERAEYLGHPGLIAVTKHSLGLILCYDEGYDEARHLLNHALRYWQKVEDWVHFVDARYCYGFSYLKAAEAALENNREDFDIATAQHKAHRDMKRALNTLESRKNIIPEGRYERLWDNCKEDLQRVKSLIEEAGQR